MTDSSLSPEALRAVVADLGFELVDVTVSGTGAGRQVQLRIDRVGGAAAGAGVTTADCGQVSRALEARLAPDGGRLEVSSPGIERPVRFVDHWRRYVGHEVQFRAAPFRGKQRARIVAVPDDAHVTLEMAGARHIVPLDAVRNATLVVDWSAIG